MTKSTAQMVSDLMLSIGTQLNDSIRLVQKTESEETFQHYRLRIAMIMADIQDKVMNPLYAEHPDIEPRELQE